MITPHGVLQTISLMFSILFINKFWISIKLWPATTVLDWFFDFVLVVVLTLKSNHNGTAYVSKCTYILVGIDFYQSMTSSISVATINIILILLLTFDPFDRSTKNKFATAYHYYQHITATSFGLSFLLLIGSTYFWLFPFHQVCFISNTSFWMMKVLQT